MGRRKKNKGILSNLKFPELNLSSDTKRGVAVVVFVFLGLLTLMATINLAGSLGRFLLDILRWGFGVLSYFVPLLLFLVAIQLARHKFLEDEKEREKHNGFYWRIYLGAFLLLGSVSGVIHIFYLANGEKALSLAREGRGGGFLGAIFGGPSHEYLGFWAGNLILFSLFVIALLVVFDISLHRLWQGKDSSEGEKENKKQDSTVIINSMTKEGFISDKVIGKNKKLVREEEDGEEGEEKEEKEKKTVVRNIAKDSEIKMDAIKLQDRKDWKLPSFDLLSENSSDVDSGDIESNVAIIKKTLEDFGIKVEMGEVNVGPTVTQYTLKPNTGVKLSQIVALQNDLALALAAHSIRMELPIPGKALVGIEVPNKSTAIVRLREVMQTKDFVDHKSKLAIALGRDVAGYPMVSDLAKMPHLLIAGATGTGKSVAINSLFTSLLYRNTPQDVKFIVIDPKRVELNLYNGIPHLLTPVIIDYEKAINSLKWSVAEMDRRYRLLSETGFRNIIEYNSASELKLPYIVIIVDELADLMAVAQSDVEAAIVRLAQMARAVGIHLVVATQRPSVDIITGLIKANITSRVAFAVASQVDSRTILDSSGAEKLLGNGDMLYTSAEFNKPKRVQGAYIGEKEVKKVVEFFRQQAGAVIYNEEILEKPKRGVGIGGVALADDDADDELLSAAKEEVIRAGKASASLLQRRLRIGYARAARLLDILEDKGIIGPGDGAKPREVYESPAEEEE